MIKKGTLFLYHAYQAYPFYHVFWALAGELRLGYINDAFAILVPMNRVVPKVPQVYQLAALPGALDPEIRAKEAEIAFTKSPRGTARLVACIAVAAFGVLGLMYSVFYTLVPWFYGVSVVAVGIGGAASKKFWLERKEGPKTLADWRTCQSDTAAGTPFRRFLESGTKREFTWAKIQEAHGEFKKAQLCIGESG